MVQNIKDLSPNSRVWIYQSDRPFSIQEQTQMANACHLFLQQWAAHGSDLKAAAETRHDHFLIIAADESFTQASGCSIDSQFRFVQELAKKMDIDLFNRTNLAFLINNRVQLTSMKKLKTEISDVRIKAKDTFFDNTVKTLDELSSKWMVNANESWLKRYFNAVETV